MSAQRSSFEKLQRDRAKKAKAAAKRERRLEKVTDVDPAEAPDVDVTEYGEELSAAELLQLVESLHKQFDAGRISHEEFEEQKTELFARLPID